MQLSVEEYMSMLGIRASSSSSGSGSGGGSGGGSGSSRVMPFPPQARSRLNSMKDREAVMANPAVAC